MRTATLNPKATAIFHRIITGINEVGDSKRHGEYGDPIMPLAIECIDHAPDGTRIISLAHYFIQEGDLCSDPQVVFWMESDRCIVPMTFEQSIPSLYQIAARFEEGKLHFSPKMQRDITTFCNQWMVNLSEQFDFAPKTRIERLEGMPVVGNAFSDSELFKLAHEIIADESEPLPVRIRAMQAIDRAMGMPLLDPAVGEEAIQEYLRQTGERPQQK